MLFVGVSFRTALFTFFPLLFFQDVKSQNSQNALGWKRALKLSLVPTLLPWKEIVITLRNSTVPAKNQCCL